MDILKVKYATVLFTERAEERKSEAEIISINHFQLPHAFIRLQNSCAWGKHY